MKKYNHENDDVKEFTSKDSFEYIKSQKKEAITWRSVSLFVSIILMKLNLEEEKMENDN